MNPDQTEKVRTVEDVAREAEGLKLIKFWLGMQEIVKHKLSDYPNLQGLERAFQLVALAWQRSEEVNITHTIDNFQKVRHMYGIEIRPIDNPDFETVTITRPYREKIINSYELNYFKGLGKNEVRIKAPLDKGEEVVVVIKSEHGDDQGVTPTYRIKQQEYITTGVRP